MAEAPAPRMNTYSQLQHEVVVNKTERHRNEPESNNVIRTKIGQIRPFARIKSFLAARRLQRMVEARRNSPEIQQYRKYRAAALKGMGR